MIAIDLAGSPRRATGVAWLEEGRIRTRTVHSDEEILDIVARVGGPVGIDAPLSLPRGRTDIDKADDNHFRECDILLKSMGIPFFPITLGPMRMLTKRGMGLAQRIADLGLEVYEIYPGGSLEMLGLPRKDPAAVNTFLQPFGAKARNVDESDAAIGLFTLYMHERGAGLLLAGEDGSILLAPPALHLGRLEEGRFIRRINRFVMEARVAGRVRRVYMRDTGRMAEYLYEGNTVYVTRKSGGIGYLLRAVRGEDCKVMADPFLDTPMVRLWLRTKGIKATTEGVRRERSTFDLSWRDCVCEVKGANMHGPRGALFPDVYSERAERHFRTLAGMDGCRWLVFVAHFPAESVSINPTFPSLEGILKGSTINIKALSTRIIDEYWVFEREVPFLWNS